MVHQIQAKVSTCTKQIDVFHMTQPLGCSVMHNHAGTQTLISPPMKLRALTGQELQCLQSTVQHGYGRAIKNVFFNILSDYITLITLLINYHRFHADILVIYITV